MKLEVTAKTFIEELLEKKFIDKNPTPEELFEELNAALEHLMKVGLSEKSRIRITKDIYSHYQAKNSEVPFSITDRSAPKWIKSKEADINWFFWQRFKSLIKSKLRGREYINRLEETVNKVMDGIGDPSNESNWSRIGLVVGNVQSGKTENYLGLINKAIDSGFKIIVVLGGHLVDLREQTQARINEGVIGLNRNKEPFGVGLDVHQAGLEKKPQPICLTVDDDFKQKNMHINLDSISGAVILVVKKNSSVLKGLLESLVKDNQLKPDSGKKSNHQLMLIDDEADYASVDTNYDKDKDPTTINKRIRDLLKLFNRSAYVGYTATPFANIFMDPSSYSAKLEKDLFPSHFLVKIPTPDAYVGHKHYFLQNDLSVDYDPVVEVSDYLDIFPEKHGKDLEVHSLPESMIDAIYIFLIAYSIRICRGEENRHCSMLVNVSHYTAVQNQIEKLIAGELDYLRDESDFSFGYELEEAKNKSNKSRCVIERFEKLFNEHYLNVDDIEHDFSKVFKNLRRAIKKTEVIATNSSSDKSLDYGASEENGLTVIAIGGNKLSRGLTLEELVVSYFTRTTKMYDTLLQMCRWFGYRPTTKSLCRLFISEDSFNWYRQISQGIEELYEDFRIMSQSGKTPAEFGLKVRYHPTSPLLITAKNKLQIADIIHRDISFHGTKVYRFEFKRDEIVNKKNLDYFKSFANSLLMENDCECLDDYSNSLLIKNVGYEKIVEWVNNLDLIGLHYVSNDILTKQLHKFSETGQSKFRVLIKNISKRSGKYKITNPDNGSLESIKINAFKHGILPSLRVLELSRADTFKSKSLELGEKSDEWAVLDKNIRDKLRDKRGSSSSSYLTFMNDASRNFPVLIIYTMAILTKQDNGEYKCVFDAPTVGYSLSFPLPPEYRDKGYTIKDLKRLNKENSVTYMGNDILIKEMNDLEDWRSYEE